MGKKFQMLEDLERIIDSGYGESHEEPERVDEEKKLMEQRLGSAIDSVITAGNDAKHLFESGKIENAVVTLSGVIEYLGNALSEMKGDGNE